ncbi:MAG: hypothetical protein ACI823_002592 [Chitinophagales bacterium]|jgi:hypothetical protein
MFIILNRKDVIITVGDSWDYELITGGQEPLSRGIIDKHLFSFIQGDVTKISVNAVLTRARSLKNKLSRSYRCDELGVRRYCEMRITPLKDGKLKIDHFILRVESRVLPIDSYTYNSVNEREKKTRRCSMCCKYKYENTWLEIEDYLIIKRLSSEDFLFGNVDYDLCPKCKTNYSL